MNKDKSLLDNTPFHTQHWGIKRDVDNLLVKREQYIPQEFIDDCRAEYADSITMPDGSLGVHACSIPVLWVEKWKREGFDIHVEPVEEIIKRLRKEELDFFITSKKV